MVFRDRKARAARAEKSVLVSELSSRRQSPIVETFVPGAMVELILKYQCHTHGNNRSVTRRRYGDEFEGTKNKLHLFSGKCHIKAELAHSNDTAMSIFRD